MQAVTTGAYKAVDFIKKNFNLNKAAADIEDSKSVVKYVLSMLKRNVEYILGFNDPYIGFRIFRPILFLLLIWCLLLVFGLFQAIFRQMRAVHGIMLKIRGS